MITKINIIEKEYKLIFHFLMYNFKEMFRRSIIKNLAYLTLAFIILFDSTRGNYGGLTLCAVARAIPIMSYFKNKYKRLNRFLDNKYFDPHSLALCLITMILKNYKGDYAIAILDQTSIGDVNVIMAGIPYEGRCMPLAWIAFEYPMSLQCRSKNYMENIIINWIQEIFPKGINPLFIMDRGYARVGLVQMLNAAKQLYIIRSPRNVMVEATIRGRRKKLTIGRLPHKVGKITIYKNCLYHSIKQEKVNIYVYGEPNQKETWYLITPCYINLPAYEIVKLYKSRMTIEQGFRDWKTHLGLRGLKLRVRKSERILRLLMGFSIAYMLILMLGNSELANSLREYMETERRIARHGTKKILSALTLALSILCSLLFTYEGWQQLKRIINKLNKGKGAFYNCNSP